MYKIEKIGNPILIDKESYWWKYFYIGQRNTNLDS
jgi:hypothetical protein